MEKLKNHWRYLSFERQQNVIEGVGGVVGGAIFGSVALVCFGTSIELFLGGFVVGFIVETVAVRGVVLVDNK